MKATFESYSDPSMRELAGWAGVITLPEGGPHGDGWCIFVPSDGGAPVVTERDENSKYSVEQIDAMRSGGQQ